MSGEIRYGYMDHTDFYWEVGEARGGNTIYSSIKDLLKNQPCAKECGIVRVRIEVVSDETED